MCAIFGVFHAKKAAELCVIGLHGNQHRAIDYAGIVSSDGANLYRERGAGLARQVFNEDMLTRLHGLDALGHLRYPTVVDDEKRDNIQPIMGTYDGKPIAIAHNGNLTNVEELRKLLPDTKFSTNLDTEYILRLLEARCTGKLEDDLIEVFKLLKGSYALGILVPGRMIAVRDASGNRPISIGGSNGSYYISSESAVFANLEAKRVLVLEPGSMVSIDSRGLSVRQYEEPREKKCRFEAIYYGHPASTIFGERVTRFRIKLGEVLEEAYPTPGADFVCGVPDSATLIGLGYGKSGRSGEYFPFIFRNHYVGRSFIAATQAKRDDIVSQKFQFTADEIKGAKLVVVDDSIVRGTTMRKLVHELRFLEAREVHIRIGCPPITHSCTYGINTPTREELIAAMMPMHELREWVGADSLEFLPMEVLRSLSPEPESFCFSCMTGKYWQI